MDAVIVKKVALELLSVANSEGTPEGAKTWLIAKANALAAAEEVNPAHVRGATIPDSLGAQADLYAEVRQARLDKDKESAAIKERESEIYNAILSTLNESADTGASGQYYRVQRIEKTVLNVADWSAFHGFVKAIDGFEMLQRRINGRA